MLKNGRRWRGSIIKDKNKWRKMRRGKRKGVRKTNLIVYTVQERIKKC